MGNKRFCGKDGVLVVVVDEEAEVEVVEVEEEYKGVLGRGRGWRQSVG